MHKEEKVVFIGARSGSKRIPNKNIKLLGNHPLVAYPIMTGLQLKLRTFVSSDSPKILDISKSYGADTILRPQEFSTDRSVDIEWIRHALNDTYAKENEIPSTIIFLRPTTPIRDISVVEQAISTFNDKSSSLRSVEPLKEAIQKSLAVDGTYLISAYPFTKGQKLLFGDDPTVLPNQTFPTSYMANGYIDILRSRHILENGDLYGKNVQAFITSKVADIDTEEDFKYAEWLLSFRK